MTPSSTDPASSLDVTDDDLTTKPSSKSADHGEGKRLGTDLQPPAAQKPQTAQGRIDRWHRKLLDLTLRNRLLNFKSTKKTIPFLCPGVSLLENRLAGGKQLKIVSLPDSIEKELASEQNQSNATESPDRKQREIDYARRAMERNEICASVHGDELLKRLTNIYRSSRNDIAEGGSNTLYLAVGFLSWKSKATDTRTYRAPLLLVPVQMRRRNARSTHRLAHHEDEVRFNATLIQMLQRDFDCDLSDLENDLPRDEHGIDVPKVLDLVGQRVASLAGFQVVDECSLASFSFAKYLMWKDLVERSDQLEQNRVVRHLIQNPEKAFGSAVDSPIPQPDEMDSRFEPKELIHPLDADSSQLAAVMAAAEGHDFVLVGPPGTGKSQTIANMIAQCLANRKTVLFVAEKTAALDVVQRRLEQHGLGDFCLELHSNKAERKRFLRQLDRSWRQASPKSTHGWTKTNNELLRLRDQLNGYVLSLHHRAPNGWTPYQAIGVSVAGEQVETPELSWPDPNQHDESAYENLEKVAKEIGLSFAAVKTLKPLRAITRTNWSIQWERQLLEQCALIGDAVDAFQPLVKNFTAELGAETDDTCSKFLRNLYELACGLIESAGEDYRTVFDQHLDELPTDLDKLDKAIRAFDDASSECSATFDDEQLRIVPLDKLEHDWAIAKASYWPLSSLRKRSVRKRLLGFAKFGPVNPELDIPVIREMQRQIKAIDQNPLAKRLHLWQHRFSPIAAISVYLKRCLSMRATIQELTDDSESSVLNFDSVRQTIEPILSEPGSSPSLLAAAKRLKDGYEAFDSVLGRFEHLAGGHHWRAGSRRLFADAREMADRISESRTSLQRWTIWQDVRQRASALGIEPLASACESGDIPVDAVAERFRLAYVRWWLSRTIDSNPTLRQFQRLEHEHAIQRFGQCDSKARRSAADRVRSSIAHKLPQQSEVPRKSELGLLRHQIGLKRPSKSIREMVAMMPEHFSALAPCLLMSPLSIAQYLPADHPPFDVVIFDEASQITTWDAIGAIARGQQTIIVGDPKQLPPTNFFGKSNDDEDDEDLEDYERDLESILDEAKASGLPTLQLHWHYRSRHESLIAFSNRHYYEDKLVTFPSPETVDQAVRLRHLPDTHYDRGKTRTNPAEAEAIVAEAVSRMRQWLSLPQHERKTLGVVTFNSQQQTLIQDLFDEAQQEDPNLEWFFSDDRIEPTVVKNLENVQGDERDVMLFSITFGPDESGRVPLTFGALNRDGGERRLNVAITRAREELQVFSSFCADQLSTEKTKSRGIIDLKHFLAFAEQTAYQFSHTQARDGDDQSLTVQSHSLESAIARRLRDRGWDVLEKVGVSGFRVPLAIRSPNNPTVYLAGIECDGVTYRDSATARDRDKTRQLVLENLGWTILRVWARDWWYDPDGATDRLDQELRSLAGP